MEIGSYDVAGVIGGYGTQSTSQTSSKPFTIPIWGEDIAKTDNVPKTSKSRDFTLTKGYDPFKDMAKTGSIKLPEYMQTKTEPTRSDEAILKEVEELAKEEARTGIRDEQRFLELRDEYLSSVSPDRDGILKSKVNEILHSGIINSRDEDKNKDKDKEAIDYFIESYKNREAQLKDINSNIVARGYNIATSNFYMQNGDVKDLWVENGAVKNAVFYDNDGQEIMNFSDRMADSHNKHGLFQTDTKEEVERFAEMRGVYGATYDFAIGRYRPPQERVGTGDSKLVNGGDTATPYIEAYNSTYKRLTSGII